MAGLDKLGQYVAQLNSAARTARDWQPESENSSITRKRRKPVEWHPGYYPDDPGYYSGPIDPIEKPPPVFESKGQRPGRDSGWLSPWDISSDEEQEEAMRKVGRAPRFK